MFKVTVDGKFYLWANHNITDFDKLIVGNDPNNLTRVKYGILVDCYGVDDASDIQVAEISDALAEIRAARRTLTSAEESAGIDFDVILKNGDPVLVKTKPIGVYSREHDAAQKAAQIEIARIIDDALTNDPSGTLATLFNDPDTQPDQLYDELKLHVENSTPELELNIQEVLGVIAPTPPQMIGNTTVIQEEVKLLSTV